MMSTASESLLGRNPKAPEPPTGLRILVVAEGADGVQPLTELMRACGHEIRLVGGGADAWRAAEDGWADVVFLRPGPFVLPGPEVPPHGKRPLFIALAGQEPEETHSRSAEDGVDLYLAPSVDPRQLLRFLDRFQSILV